MKPLVSSYYDCFQQVLLLSLTARCPIECRHCGVFSGPKRTEQIPAQTLLPQLEEAASAGLLKGLLIGGGDPFIALPLLRQILALANRYELAVAVQSSAFWATSQTRARKLLQTLPGLSQLQISSDQYHLEFLSLAQIKNALQAAVACHISAQLIVCTWHQAHDDFYHQIMASLGNELLNQIEVIHNEIEPIGRAEKLPEAKQHSYSDEFPPGRCTLVNRPTVMESGELAACCNLSVAAQNINNPLRLGKLQQQSLAELFSGAQQNYLIQALRTGGPAYLAGLVETRLPGALRQRLYRIGNICDLCSELWRRPSIAAAVQQALTDPEVQTEIATFRALLFGETEMLEQIQADCDAALSNALI